jgi:hypothetical protein
MGIVLPAASRGYGYFPNLPSGEAGTIPQHPLSYKIRTIPNNPLSGEAGIIPNNPPLITAH